MPVTACTTELFAIAHAPVNPACQRAVLVAAHAWALDLHQHPTPRHTSTASPSSQVCEAIKLLMDTDTMEQPMEKNDFVDMVYDKMIDQLVGVILRWGGGGHGL